MGRGINDSFMPDYPDIVPIHPERKDWTEEDYEKEIVRIERETENMTEWPDI